MEDGFDWEDCDISAAAADVVGLLPLFQQFAREEQPDSDLYLSSELINAISTLRQAPSVTSAKTLVKLAPTFFEIFEKRTPLGKAREKGSVLAQVLFEEARRTSSDFYVRFERHLMRTQDDFLSDELLIVAYLVPHLITHDNEQWKAALMGGFDRQFSRSMFEGGLVFGDSNTYTQVYTMIVGDFRKNVNRATGTFSEDSLNRIVTSISRGSHDLLLNYPHRLKSLGNYVMSCIDEVLNKEDS